MAQQCHFKKCPPLSYVICYANKLNMSSVKKIQGTIAEEIKELNPCCWPKDPKQSSNKMMQKRLRVNGVLH